ncbi:flavin reductase [Marmoricola endophyticus]|uniref:Flavin reductase n=1 Tax=Marmoricola endophyticus TaxID=2040280 RepID=A0A917BLV1_9ACTN|nr:flavin reductase family protein [Marmoricola endophyticus]GGF51177.1 flavin reductase [Marmoricola endophyticus]
MSAEGGNEVTIAASDLDPEQTYRLLSGVVVPRPIAWITTVDEAGVVNLAPFSCYTFVSTAPPLIGVNVGRKAGTLKDTGTNIERSGEFVVNVPAEEHSELVHLSAVEHPPATSEVDLLGLETSTSRLVTPPRLALAPLAMECRWQQTVPFGRTGSQFMVGEVVCFHVREDLWVDGKVDTPTLRPLARLGGPTYATIGEPVTHRGIAQTAKSVIP